MDQPQQPRKRRLAVVIPCYNEAVTIQKVIGDFRHELPDAAIVVIDNNSTDGTAKIAAEAGAHVLTEKRQGKGNAIKTMFDAVDADFYILVDGDDTYYAEDVHRLLPPLFDDEADMVVGSRLEGVTNESMTLLHQFGNRLLLNIINLTFRINLKDFLSGYKLMNRKFVQSVPILSSGFEIEAELVLQALENGLRIQELPIRYRARPEGSESKLKSFRDGTRNLLTIISILRDYRPMTFFPVVAGIVFLAGLIAGSVVVLDYLDKGTVTRLPLAVLSTSLVIISFLTLITGFVVGTINRRFKEMSILLTRQFKRSKKIE